MRAPGSIARCLTTVLLLSGTLSACRSTSQPHPDGSVTTVFTVVTSTDVYGDIATQIAGPDARVTAIIANPLADPHSYSADAQDALAVSKASVIVENGGGYDDFLSELSASVGRKSAVVLNAVDLSGKTQNDSLNEHVF